MPFPLYVPDFKDEVFEPILLTSIQEMERVLGAKGIRLHIQDLDPANDEYDDDTDIFSTTENVLEEYIQRVSSKVLQYLEPRFDAKLCSQNPSIREIATYWACHDISRRRGNEPLYEAEVAEGIERLERYRDGSLYLNIPSSRPRVYSQAFITDNRYLRNPTRVLRSASTEVVAGQKMAYEYPFFWL